MADKGKVNHGLTIAAYRGYHPPYRKGPPMRMLLLVAVVLTVLQPAHLPGGEADRVQVAAYYFPNYHADARNEALKGKGWSEWELVKAAKPRFTGHHQPNLPQWGCTDEADPQAMAQRIAAAADHGLDAFIFDWYWYDDGPFLQRGLDEGFLKAANNSRLRFALMWANHDWTDIHPKAHKTQPPTLYRGRVTPATFDRICDHVITHYFSHPSYWRIAGKPYFSVYELFKLVESCGGVAQTKAALDRFRAKAVAAGLPGIHLNAVTWGVKILPGEQTVQDPASLVAALGFDSVTSYVWIHHVALPQQQTPYDQVRDRYLGYWDKADGMYGIPYYPNVTMGWDASPRCRQSDPFDNSGYPFMNTMAGNTPARFQEALRQARERLMKKPAGQRILTLNAWNEWTEGSYLEPDTVNGMGYLEAIRAVFGTTAP